MTIDAAHAGMAGTHHDHPSTEGNVWLAWAQSQEGMSGLRLHAGEADRMDKATDVLYD